MPDEEREAPEPSQVAFLHGHTFREGYVLDVTDPVEGLQGQWVVRWADFDDSNNRWMAHDMVELFAAYTLPQVAQALDGRDFVLYLDCLRTDCGEPHLYNRRMLAAGGYLNEDATEVVDEDDDGITYGTGGSE